MRPNPFSSGLPGPVRMNCRGRDPGAVNPRSINRASTANSRFWKEAASRCLSAALSDGPTVSPGT